MGTIPGIRKFAAHALPLTADGGDDCRLIAGRFQTDNPFEKTDNPGEEIDSTAKKIPRRSIQALE